MSTCNKSEKKTLKLIRNQLEFYFSEGNLPHDKFMQKCIVSSNDKSVQITDLLKFNKLIELGATEENILRALVKSDLLVVDRDGSGIKRKLELNELKPADSRTIYVCGFPIYDAIIDIDQYVRQVFDEYGIIVRVDVPKYPTSKTVKGFAFVEFLTRTSARATMSVYKPTDKDCRKAAAWQYFSYSNSQYSHALKQMEMLGHSQKLFFDDFLGEQRKLKTHDKLIAIAKKEWLQFRTQFYEAQKSHLNEMKRVINTYQTQQALLHPCSHKLHEQAKIEKVLTATGSSHTVDIAQLSNQILSGSIVAFQCSEGNTKKTIKSFLASIGAVDNVAYIDFRDFNLSGYLRFKTGDSARDYAVKNAAAAGSQLLESVQLLTATQELEYLDRISQDKESKKQSQKRKNQRKKSKLCNDVTE